MIVKQVQGSEFAPANPFSTCFVRPGALPFQYPEGLDRQKVITDFFEVKQASIAGPHGVGKSTLVMDLLPELESSFDEIDSTIIRKSESQWQHQKLKRCLGEPTKRLLLIDGLERLSLIQRGVFRSFCRRSDQFVLATVHQKNFGFHSIVTLEPNVLTFKQVVRGRIANCAIQLPDIEILSAFKKANGNSREAIMHLFDEWERRKQRRGNEH